jgi:hypothetical protein
MRTKRTAIPGALLALLLVAGCGSTGGDIFGGGNQPVNSPTSNTIRGTVDSVDTNGRSILLTDTNGYSSMLSGGGNNDGRTVRVYFDNRTTVEYQGQSHRPEDLDRGDQVDVAVSQSGNRLVADRIDVIYNAAGNTTYPGNNGNTGNNGSYGSTVSGTVTNVDTSRRTLTVDTGYGRTTVVDYDTNVPVSYNGRTFNVADLERGDQIDIRTRNLGNGRYVADSVNVIRSISDSGTSGSNGSYGNAATIRGTVQYIDTARQTIELAQTSWINGFAGNGSGGGNTIVVRYDTSVRVDANGQLSAVTNLERGDVVDVEVQSGNTTTPFARSIRLVRDVRQ